LEMATGTGKTVTALTAATECFRDFGRVALVVAVPYLHLLDQWAENCRQFGFKPVLCGSAQEAWRAQIGAAIRDYRLGYSNALCVVAVHQTAASEEFARLIARIPEELLLFIGDEVHALGARGLRRALPPSAEMRLGLSATPRRWLDDEGTQVLNAYFGGVCFEFSLEKAIQSGFLTPYDYFPVVVAFSEEELVTYRNLTLRIAQHRRLDDGSPPDEALKRLLVERARVVWGAEAKQPMLLSLLKNMIGRAAEQKQRLSNILVYCAPGEHKAVLRAVAGLGIRCHEFVHTVSPSERQLVLQRFEERSVEALVAIRCLDEGVDLPATQTAFFLASTTNPRQFIQRRGRVLRLSPGKSKAQIFDFLVLPADDVSEENHDAAISLLRREMPRFAEFSSAASNGFGAREVVFPVLNAFGMLDLLDKKPWDLFKEIPRFDREDEDVIAS
jgi:superfamily II DNA or RNA helicase